MLIYTIIIFGIAVIRAANILAQSLSEGNSRDKIGTFLVFATLAVAYGWFLIQFVILK